LNDQKTKERAEFEEGVKNGSVKVEYSMPRTSVKVKHFFTYLGNQNFTWCGTHPSSVFPFSVLPFNVSKHIIQRPALTGNRLLVTVLKLCIQLSFGHSLKGGRLLSEGHWKGNSPLDNDLMIKRIDDH
jgi:hypothetical protein